MKFDLAQTITDQIVAAIENGQAHGAHWRMPWDCSLGKPRNAKTKHGYRGVNIILLTMLKQARGYNSNYWASFKQWGSMGFHVAKGEKGTMITFMGTAVKSQENEGGETEEKAFKFLRYYNVFNAEQLTEPYMEPDQVPPNSEHGRMPEIEDYIANTNAVIAYGNEKACYIPSMDMVCMPDMEAFRNTKYGKANEHYYSTLFHELTHWTGHKARCDRQISNCFGNEKYAAEELVAELGAAFQCGALGLSKATREDHAHYVASWLKALKGDKRAIFHAARLASDAVDYLESLQAG